MVVRGKITQINETTVIGSKRLKLCQTLNTDATASIPLDIWKDHIQTLTLGSVYTFSPLQVRVWGGRKKLTTVKRTLITPILDDDTLNAVSEVQENTIVVEEFVSMQKYDNFLKCQECHRRLLQRACLTIVTRQRCGMMRADKCKTGLTTKVIYKHISLCSLF